MLYLLAGLIVGGWSASTFGTHTNAGGDDAFIVGYDSNGNLLASQFLSSSADDHINSLAIGSDGGAYVTGYTFGSLGGPNLGGPDIFVAKITGVPEPSSMALTILGFCAVVTRRRRQPK